MKLKHFFLLILALPLVACDDFSTLQSYHTYGNATENVVTLKTYIIDQHTGDMEETSSFSIAPGEEHTIASPADSNGEDRANRPFIKIGNCLTFSNGERIVTQYSQYAAPGTLFSNYTYERFPTKKAIYLKYVFTDKSFELGELILPEE